MIYLSDFIGSNLHLGEVYNIMWYSMSVACDISIFFTMYSGFLHQ